jgi:HEAT repeat protein
MSVPWIYFPVRGFFCREHFYAGWPTSYWADRLKKHTALVGSTGDVGKELAKGGAEAVPVLFEILRDAEPDVGVEALLALRVIEPLPASATPLLIDLVQNGRTPSYKQWAAHALSKVPYPDGEVIPALRGALGDEDRQVRFAALGALWNRRVHEPEMLPVVSELLTHNPYTVTVHTNGVEYGNSPGSQGIAIPDFSPSPHPILAQNAAEALPDLLQELKDPRDAVRASAVSVLAQLHRNRVGPILANSLGDPSPAVRAAAVFACLAESPEDIPLLITALADTSLLVCRLAIVTLQRRGPAGRRAVPKLIELLQSEDPEIRVAAAVALAHIDPQSSSEAALPVVLEELKTKNKENRSEIYYALAAFYTTSEQGLQAVAKMLAEEQAESRWALIAAVGELGPRAKSAVPLLVARLSDKDEVMQMSAVFALRRIGPDAKAAVPALKKLVESKGPLAQAAAEALENIDPKKSQSQTSSAPPQ